MSAAKLALLLWGMSAVGDRKSLTSSCNLIVPGVHIYMGPKMERHPQKEQSSACYCPRCKRRTVQTLVCLAPVMDPETMREDQLMAAAFCGPEFVWECACGGTKPADRECDW